MAFGLTVRTPLTGSPNGSDCESEGFGLGEAQLRGVIDKKFFIFRLVKIFG